MPGACTGDFDQPLLSGFLDGVISARDRQVVRAHLVTCAECRRVLSDLTEIRQACLSTCLRISRFELAGDRPSGKSEVAVLISGSRDREAG